MAPGQKCAWIQLANFAIFFTAWLIVALAGRGSGGGWELAYDRPAAMWIAQIGTVIAAGVAFAHRRRRGSTEIVEDERDGMIWRRSFVVAGAASHTTLIVLCLVVLAVYKRLLVEDAIPLDLLVAVVVAAGAVWFLVLCVTALASYGREA